MRASGRTAVASTITKAAPPTARLPRCTRCQSVARPFSQQYWHIGETAIRFTNRTSRILSSSKSPFAADGDIYSVPSIGFRKLILSGYMSIGKQKRGLDLERGRAAVDFNRLATAGPI